MKPNSQPKILSPVLPIPMKNLRNLADLHHDSACKIQVLNAMLKCNITNFCKVEKLCIKVFVFSIDGIHVLSQ